MKRLFTCGDSFMSTDAVPAQLTSFLELFAQARGYQHVSIARPGATNYIIRLQIDYAIRHCADFVIVSPTSSDRLDIPLDINFTYQPELDLSNTVYSGYRAVSENNIKADKVLFVGDTVYNFQHDKHNAPISTTQKTAIKHLLSELHNDTLQRHKDFYMIRDGLTQLVQHSIPFVFLPGAMSMFDWSYFKTLWPSNTIEPYNLEDKPPYDYNITVTHNDQSYHDSFCQTLLDITPDWA
jgi:hypothetical protein